MVKFITSHLSTYRALCLAAFLLSSAYARCGKQRIKGSGVHKVSFNTPKTDVIFLEKLIISNDQCSPLVETRATGWNQYGSQCTNSREMTFAVNQ